MSSFPSRIFDPDDIKIRYLEPFASEAIDKRFLGTPMGVYEGFTPSFLTPVVTLATSGRGVSIVRVRSTNTSSKTALDIIIEEAVTLDFSGHDFGASGDIYVVAKINYLLGSTTTAQIITQNVAPIGDTEIGICRVTGSGIGNVTGVVFLTPPDRHTPLANAFNDYGYMPGGSVEDLETLLDLQGNCQIDTTIRSATFSPLAAEVGRVFLLDMGSIGANVDINMPASAGLTEGDSFGFFSLSGVPGAFDVRFNPDGADEIVYNGAITSQAIMRKHLGHFVKYTLVTTGVTNPTWFAKILTLKDQHGDSHHEGGEDPVKLDDLATPDDNTDLNVNAARHGLMVKLSGVGSDVFKGDGTYGPVPAPAALVYAPGTFAAPGPHPVAPTGVIHRLDASGGPFTMDLPDALAIPDGSIVRFQIEVPAPGTPITIGAFAGQDVVVPDTPLGPGFVWDASFRGLFLELVLDKSISAPPLWKPSSYVRDPIFGGVPIGGIMPWWPTVVTATPPAGWHVCDGSLITDPLSPRVGERTPDLISNFWRGFGGAQGGDAGVSNANVDTGGADTHGHSPITTTVAVGAGGGLSFVVNAGGGWHIHSGFAAPGSSNVPSYVGLLPIMRIR